MKLILFILGFTCAAFQLCVAAPVTDSLSVDLRFRNARALALEGKRAEARTLCNAILRVQPDYYDAQVLRGRTFAWDQHYDSARAELKKVIARKMDHRDALCALIDVESWSNRTDSVLYYSNYGLSFHPNDEYFLLKKAEALLKLNQTDKAKLLIRRLLIINPSNPDVIALAKNARKNVYERKVSLEHTFEFFKTPTLRRWHITSVELTQGTPRGTVIARINAGDLVKSGESLYSYQTAFQYECDFYPRLSTNYYAYLNYGYSAASLFPRHRAGIELYRKLPRAFEASLGMRYLQFAPAGSSSSKVYILTGSVGKYYKSYWFSLKPFITPKSYGISQSYNLSVRRYLKSADNYLSLVAGTGVSPDDPTNNQGDITLYQLNSYRLRAAYQTLLFERWMLLVGVGYTYEEYKSANYRQSIDSNVKLSFLF